MLAPIEIKRHDFKKSFRGYNEEEVDNFLEKVAADYEKLLSDSEKYREKLMVTEKELSHYKQMGNTVQEILDTAKKTAEELLESAKKNSKELRDNAVRDSQSIYTKNVNDAQAIRDKAKMDAKKIINEANLKLRVTAAECDRIVRERNSFLVKSRAVLESELAATNHLLESIPRLESVAIKNDGDNLKFDDETAESKVEIEKKSDAEKSQASDTKSADKDTDSDNENEKTIVVNE